MFLFGVIIGMITGSFTILLIAVIHVREVEGENEYLKQQLAELAEQAEELKDEEYKYFDIGRFEQ